MHVSSAKWPRMAAHCLVALVALPLLGQGIPRDVSPGVADRLVLQDLNRIEKRLSEHRSKVVVLNFWATWCIPCRDEMPLLVNIQHRYLERGVIVIGASADDESTQSQILSFTQKLGVTFPIWKGATTEHMQLLGLGTGLPVTAVIDQEGRLAFRILGILERKELEERLEYLLTGRQGPTPAALVDRISEAMKTARSHPHGDHQEGGENHHHGGVGMEGASTVPS